MNKARLPKISFIIPTLNAEVIIYKCLTAIKSQCYPQHLIEIIVSDGGSTDNTAAIARNFGALVINNPDKLHEPGKSLAASKATGEILFFTDADNIIADNQWIKKMIKPYLDSRNVMGFLPQTIPAPDSNLIDRYLGYLFTDPLTWFIYGPEGNPKFYHKAYTPIKATKDYELYLFPTDRYPLFGFSQGVGVRRAFERGAMAYADDMLGGIKLINEGQIVAYIPQAGVYHYHVSGIKNFISKYRWRVRNNLTQQITGMGLVNRIKYFDQKKKLRLILFIPYSVSIILPFVDGVKLSIANRSIIMMIHPFVCLLMIYIIALEYSLKLIIGKKPLTEYT